MTREYLGAFWVDTATVLVGEPCQFIKDDRYEAPPILYSDFREQMQEPNTTEDVVVGGRKFSFPRRGGSKEVGAITVGNTSAGFAVTTGCDGWYRVTLVRAKDGTPKRLEIDLTAYAKRDPE